MMADERRDTGFARVSRAARAGARRIRRAVRPNGPAPTHVDAPAPVTADDLKEIGSTLREIRDELRRHRRYIETIQLELSAQTLREVQMAIEPRQLDGLATLDALTDTGRSFARFGDGEFRLALRPGFNLGFQSNRDGLRDELRALLRTTSTEDLLVGFPHLFRDAHWSGVWADVWPELREVIPGEGSYGDSHVTRPNFFASHGQDGVEAWRRVWDRQRVCVIAGRESRFEMVPALFDNVLSVQTLDAPSTQAYDAIDDIEARARDTRADVFLIALGPTGTLLAARLAAAGRQALDIGHLSSSYRTHFSGAARPEAIASSRATGASA